MAILEVPLARPEGGAAWRQTTGLGGRDYVLELDWVARWPDADGPGAWRLSLLTDAGRALARGRVLVPGVLLLRQLADPDRPAGDLVLSSPDPDPPGLDELGSRAVLLYVDGDDLAALRDARR